MRRVGSSRCWTRAVAFGTELELGRWRWFHWRPNDWSAVRREVDGGKWFHRERIHRRWGAHQDWAGTRLELQLGRPDGALAHRRSGWPTRCDAHASLRQAFQVWRWRIRIWKRNPPSFRYVCWRSLHRRRAHIHVRFTARVCGRSKVTLVTRRRPRQDSNLCTWLRRPMLYPLSYEGWESGHVSVGV